MDKKTGMRPLRTFRVRSENVALLRATKLKFEVVECPLYSPFANCADPECCGGLGVYPPFGYVGIRCRMTGNEFHRFLRSIGIKGGYGE